jgi:hypothetical protein
VRSGRRYKQLRVGVITYGGNGKVERGILPYGRALESVRIREIFINTVRSLYKEIAGRFQLNS